MIEFVMKYKDVHVKLENVSKYREKTQKAGSRRNDSRNRRLCSYIMRCLHRQNSVRRIRHALEILQGSETYLWQCLWNCLTVDSKDTLHTQFKTAQII